LNEAAILSLTPKENIQKKESIQKKANGKAKTKKEKLSITK
jgi:hypothetical protein